MESFDSTRWERLFEAIHELSVLISTGPHREEQLLERILRGAHLLLRGRYVHLLLVEEDCIRRFVFTQEETNREVLSSQVLPRSANLVKWIQQEHVSAQIPPQELVQADTPVPASDPTPLCAPLRSGGHPHGVLMVFPGHESYGPEDAKILSFLASQAAVVLEHARLYRKLEAEASTDGLTGLYNYRYFMDALQREVRRAGRFGEPFSVVMVDVDNLKEYNDRNGHLGGSSALREMGRLLRADTREIDIIAKYGGDEFSLILPNTDIRGSIVFAERMLRRISAHAFEGDPQRRLTISAGIAIYPHDGDHPRGLLSKADERLYQAKLNGRNRIGSPLSAPEDQPVSSG
jgi:diguanylate cyclase (GGDEF)-like protein